MTTRKPKKAPKKKTKKPAPYEIRWAASIYHDKSELDEICATGCDFHMERMFDGRGLTGWSAIIYAKDGATIRLSFTARQGKRKLEGGVLCEVEP